MIDVKAHNPVQIELDKAARLINAILRLMHKGAMPHEQARKELSVLPKGIAKAEIAYCVQQAMRAVDLNEQISRNTDKEKEKFPAW
ncbi:hypothetical protein [Herminiimonas contaminans]|uniref:Uncharacterized protein n=1 Tax=Herminiimonas contaminans TaxID=1111140 RepID=A0ABS0EWA3_9BURK|nr:hypothetical protein [Herminiimonas contaminans]MBF8178364.1 hypothetical protein [Herminiimonas contaminans]